MPRVSQQSTVWGTDTTWKACHSYSIAAFTMPCPQCSEEDPGTHMHDAVGWGPHEGDAKIEPGGKDKAALIHNASWRSARSSSSAHLRALHQSVTTSLIKAGTRTVQHCKYIMPCTKRASLRS